jgi:hypothetical protein
MKSRILAALDSQVGDTRFPLQPAMAANQQGELPPRHLHFAVLDGWTIILDVARNRYVSLTPDATRVWMHLQSSGRSPTVAELATERGEGLSTTIDFVAMQIEEWRRYGLLSTTRSESQLPIARRPLQPVAALDQLRDVHPSKLRLSAVVTMSLASAQRRWGSRRTTLVDVLSGIQRKCWRVAHEAELSRIGQVAETVRAYELVRALFFAGRDDCLERSVDLCLALRAQGIDSRLCFGVRTFPFSAHAWVQIGGLVVNECLSTVQKYAHIAQF